MAVAKSTIIKLTGDSNDALIKWSSLASGENNTYFDVNGLDVSKMVILVCNSNSTDVGTTAGYFYLGSSGGSACSGTSYAKTYSGGIRRLRLKIEPPTVDAKEGITGSSALAYLSISAFGPFEAARFKDSDGYIKVSKAKNTSDAGKVKIAAILIP